MLTNPRSVTLTPKLVATNGQLSRQGRRNRILIVDDDEPLRALLQHWTTEQGYDCWGAASAAECLEKLAAHEIDLVLTAIKMPGIDGIELLAAIRRHHPEVACFMVTTVDDQQTALRCLELGAFGYAIKPFQRTELLVNIASSLERQRLERINQKYSERLEEEVRLSTEQVRRREEEVALRLVWASEYRENESRAHVRRVGRYSEVIARAIGWNKERAGLIRTASLMHDIGKMGIPDGILQRPGPLTKEEFELMKKHTEIGGSILGGSSIPLLQMAEEIALFHHEHWDGGGYPRGLAGQEIPESARVVAVVDVYDSLCHDRVYRPAFPEHEAVAMIEEQRDKQFEPRILDAALESLPTLRAIRERIAEDRGE